MYERIVVPSGELDSAVLAATRALELADDDGAEIHVLFVLDAGELPDEEPFRSEALMGLVEADAEEFLTVLVGGAAERKVLLRTDACSGDPVEAILASAGAVDADAIVMGYRGYPHERSDGSVARAVRDRAACEVVLVGRNDLAGETDVLA